MRLNKVMAAASSLFLILLVFFIPTADAASIWYPTQYVANTWDGPGLYDDGLEEAYGYSNDDWMQDADDDTKMISAFQVNGALGDQATVTVQEWMITTNSSGQITAGPVAEGSINLIAKDMGTKVSTNVQCNAISVEATENGQESGYFYLHEMWGDPTPYTSSGETIWPTPSYADSSGGDTVSQSGTTSVTTDNSTTNVTVTQTVNINPPDWDQITSEIADKIAGEFPPVQPPPDGSDQIDAQPPITGQDLTPDIPNVNVPELGSTPSASTPSEPPEMGDTSYDFSSYSAISVPTSDSVPFSIPDPNDLPHQDPGTILIPGQAPPSSMIPGNSGLTYPNPTPNDTEPSYSGGPSSEYVPSGDSSGPTPSAPGPTQGTTPTPSPSTPSGASTDSPSPSAPAVSTPDYSQGSGTGNTAPMYGSLP